MCFSSLKEVPTLFSLACIHTLFQHKESLCEQSFFFFSSYVTFLARARVICLSMMITNSYKWISSNILGDGFYEEGGWEVYLGGGIGFEFVLFKHVHYRITQRDTSDSCCWLCCRSMESHSLSMMAEMRLSISCVAQSTWSNCWSLENTDLNVRERLSGSASRDWIGDLWEAGC